MIPAWIRQFFGTKSRAPIARRHAKVKPSVLVLEDRWMPAPVPVAAPTEAALTTAIMTAADGDTIVFQSPAIPNGFVFDLMTPHPPAGNSYFLLNKTLTFDASSLAAGVTLNATVAFRIFEVAPTFSLALNRISMTNGAPVAGQSGGAVLFNGGMGTTFSITGGTFSGNDTLGAGNGGAIDVLGGVFTASGTTFTTNTAGADGGAIHIGGGGAHSLTNCNLTTNSAADDGGAIELDGGTLSLNPSTVDTNTAADDGGGINVTGGTLNVSPGAQITNNTSTNGNGGGINIAGGTNHQLIGSIPNPIIIGGNRALNTPAPVAGKGHGGGINLAAGDLDLRGAQIGGAPLTTANQAVFGGGISILGGTLTANVLANPSQVKGNTATSAGGGIDIVAGIVTVSAMSATDNSVTGVNGHGGGYAIHGGTVNLSDPNASPILRNHADAAGATGGGIFQDGGTVNLTNIVVGGAPATGNTANSGAGIHVAGGTISLLAGTNVNNNTAATSGGGMLITGGTNHKITGTAMSLVSVSGNRALAGNGGGIQIAAPFASTLTSDPFMMNGNMAVGDGGGMNITVGTVIITAGDFFTNNTATGNGGGLNYAGGTGHQINGTMGNPVIIANNTAGVSGGGINLAATFTGTLAVTQTVIGGVAMFVPAAPNGNVATLGSGGGINVDIGSTGTLTLTGGRIGGADAAEGNKANISGGGINFAGGAGHTLMTALIAQNATTTGAGGGVNLAAAGVAVAFTDSTIRGNTANTSGGGFNVVVGTLSLTNCTVGGGASGLAGNVATTGDGGGLNVLGGTVNLNGGTIGGTAGVSGNTASGNGGGIEFAGGTINFIAGAPTVVRFNHATGGAGGGLDISANLNLSIDNGTDFLDNDASTNGGGIAQRGNNALSISNVANSADILRNTANNNDGGGLFLGGSGNTGLLNVNINANVAAQNGGGISKGGVGVLTINIATLDLNRAESGDGGGMSVVGGVAGSAGNPSHVLQQFRLQQRRRRRRDRRHAPAQ
jgi:fibronectin-binding autotransporter adhesin